MAFINNESSGKCPTYSTGENDFIIGFGTIKEGDWVFKAGCSSITSGKLNYIHRRVN
jgi:hypothetical protein